MTIIVFFFRSESLDELVLVFFLVLKINIGKNYFHIIAFLNEIKTRCCLINNNNYKITVSTSKIQNKHKQC